MEKGVIPPVHSEEKKDLEQEFLKIQEELPGFKEHELEEKDVKQAKPTHEELPFELVHRIIRATCLVALVVWFVLIVFLSIITLSNPFNTLVGLSPVLLTIIITYILVDKYHLESGFLMIFPFIFTGILFMLGAGNLLNGIDYKTLSSVNIIFGLLFVMAVIVHYGILRKKIKVKEVKEKKEQKLIIKLDDEAGIKSFVSSIEDKSKAINAAIGRVYSVRRGGTEPLRKKIKIDAAHYNEFNELKNEKPEKRNELAVNLLRKIKERLELLQKPEKDVFDTEDFASLLNLDRNPDGKDKIIDVLVKNDKDPVKAYYDGALEFCNDAIEELEKE